MTADNTPQPYRQQPDVNTVLTRAAQVQATLQALRVQHALGICQFGTDLGDFAYPHGTRKALATPAGDIADNLVQGHPQSLLSVTVAPATRSVKPWETRRDMLPQLGYTVNLSQDSETSARIVRVHPNNLDSGSHDGKDLKLGIPTGISELDAFYAQFGGNEALLKQAIGGEHGLAYGRFQLDALGRYIVGLDPARESNLFFNPKLSVLRHNEAVVAVAAEHVMAIHMAVFEVRDMEFMAPLYDAVGAIAGLQHLQQGIDLPVVMYYVERPNHIGEYVYFAQGQDELTAKLDTALGTLHEQGAFEVYPENHDPNTIVDLTDALKGLGIDPSAGRGKLAR